MKKSNFTDQQISFVLRMSNRAGRFHDMSPLRIRLAKATYSRLFSLPLSWALGNMHSRNAVRLALLLVSSSIAAQHKADAATIEVMSFNVRYASDFESTYAPPNGWFDSDEPDKGRRVRALSVIRNNQPDVLGVQESERIQSEDLQAELSSYDYFGVGRDDGINSGEQNGIFYRSDRFRRTDGGHFWLSDTPDDPGTTFATGYDSGNSRMATWVALHDLLTGKPLVVLNTHWSLNGTARRKSAALILERLSGLAGDVPMIMTGDLNAWETEVQQLLTSSDHLLVDSFRQVHPQSQYERTYHGYLGSIIGPRIDYIFYSKGDFRTIDATIDRSAFGGLYPSDHFPVTATLSIVPEPIATPLPSMITGCAGMLRRKRSHRV